MREKIELRINQKQQISSMLDELICCDVAYRKQPENISFAQQLQEKAILMGSLIEKYVGTEIYFISLLEEYCELVYQSSIIGGKNDVFKENRQKILSALQKKMERDVLQKKNEVVFMPYKFCMWDSMESVYQEACSDTEWKAVVLPVPYTLKREQRKVYEGTLFSTISGYQKYWEYDLKKEMPDVIVIHNPYDQYNTITEIDRQFQSEEIKKYTERLVYIPYFISMDNKMDPRQIILPGIRNATDIIVQSETVRQQYLSWYPQKKILALGSPKVDRIINSVNNKQNTGRTFFLNNHLDMVQNEPRKLIERISSLIDFFKGHREYVLIWRPHPLSISSFEDKHDKYDYIQLIERVNQTQNIIYDDSEDFYDALVSADAYIGDRSSLVTLFGMMGKPIYLFEREEKYFKVWDENLLFLHCENWHNRFWVLGRKTPGIYSFDYDLNDVKLEFDLHQLVSRNLYFLCLKRSKMNIYIFYENSMCVGRLNEETKEWKVIKPENIKLEEKYIVQQIYEYKNNYYLIPAYIDLPLIRFDGEKLTECYGWKEKIKHIVNNGEKVFTLGCIFEKEKMWTVIPDTDILVETNLENFQITCWKISNGEYKLETIGFDGERFYLAGSSQRIVVCWTAQQGVEKVYKQFPVGFDFGLRCSFSSIEIYENTVWFIPGSATSILIFDKNNEEWRTIEIRDYIVEDFNADEYERKFLAVKCQDDRLFIFSYGIQQNLVIDMALEKIIMTKKLHIDIKDLKTMQWAYLEDFNECTNLNCVYEVFIKFVNENYRILNSQKEKYLCDFKNVGESGLQIWKELRNMQKLDLE